jgi:GAF domain-containing protein
MRQAWEQIATEKKTIGYKFSASKVNTLEAPLDMLEIQTAIETGEAIASAESSSNITIPLKLRDEVIGVLDVRSSTTRNWNENELAIIQAVAERVSLALENARLFEETTRRADRERTVSEITTHIRSTTDPQAMLSTALEELKRALGAREIRIRPFTPPTTEQPGD